jgi:hypothetical protein
VGAQGAHDDAIRSEASKKAAHDRFARTKPLVRRQEKFDPVIIIATNARRRRD